MYAELRLMFPDATSPRAMSRLVNDLGIAALAKGATTSAGRVVYDDPSLLKFSEPDHDCNVTLKRSPDYSPSAGTPTSFTCTCGKRYVIVESESEGTWWERVLT
jgi:hypothetical protein